MIKSSSSTPYILYKLLAKNILFFANIFLLTIFVDRCSTLEYYSKRMQLVSYPDMDPNFLPDHIFYSLSESQGAITIAVHMHTHTVPSSLFMDRESFVIANLPEHISFIKEPENMILDIEKKLAEGKKILLLTDSFLDPAFDTMQGKENLSVIFLDNGTLPYYHLFTDTSTSDDCLQYFTSFYNLLLQCLVSKNIYQERIVANFPFHSVTAWYHYPEKIYDRGLFTHLCTKEQFMSCIQKLDKYLYWKRLSSSDKESVKRMFLFDESTFAFFDQSESPITLFLEPVYSDWMIDPYYYVQYAQVLFGKDILCVLKSHPKDCFAEESDPLMNCVIPKNIPIEIFLFLYEDKIRALVGCNTSAFFNVPPKIEVYTLGRMDKLFGELGLEFPILWDTSRIESERIRSMVEEITEKIKEDDQ